MEKRKNENENKNENLVRGKYFQKNAERLEAVTREEQNEAYDRATRLAEWRLRSRMHRSIHSEMGNPPYERKAMLGLVSTFASV